MIRERPFIIQGSWILAVIGPIHALGVGIYNGLTSAVTALDELQLRLRARR